jgi:hypothetical protein
VKNLTSTRNSAEGLARAELFSLGNQNVTVATAEDLIIMKAIAGQVPVGPALKE